jgi:uncharacterized protein (DUF1330 family)
MKAYTIATMDIHDHEKYMSEYVPKAVKLLETIGGKVLVRGGKTMGDNAPKGRVLVVEYPSFEKAEAMVASPEWQEAIKIAEKYATVSGYLIEGVD